MLIVIPARGGSKRLSRKNIRPLAGKPLLVYAIEAARAANVTPDVAVSTEDENIAAVAREHGVRVIDRPQMLAVDRASTESVLLHALDMLEREERRFTWVMTLSPSSPLRCPGTIRKFVEVVRGDPQAPDCLMSVHEHRGDFWRLQPDGSLRRLFPEAPRRQQEREPLWEENSAIYVTRVDALRSTGSVLGNSVRGLAIHPVEAIDIHTSLDLLIAESILQSLGGEVPDALPGRTLEALPRPVER